MSEKTRESGIRYLCSRLEHRARQEGLMTDPLPARAAEYVADGNPDATPDEVLREADLDESWRAQVEHYLAVTRYTMFKNDEGNDADGLRWDTVGWSDVAEWDV
jgi:hypothetical protein